VSRKRRSPAPRVPKKPPSRVSSGKVLDNLRLAAKKGDRSALELALAEMRTLALSPRYWEKYLALLRNPLARLVDLTTIKQGDRIAHQKGWKLPKSAPPKDGAKAKRTKKERDTKGRVTATPSHQPSLFDL